MTIQNLSSSLVDNCKHMILGNSDTTSILCIFAWQNIFRRILHNYPLFFLMRRSKQVEGFPFAFKYQCWTDLGQEHPAHSLPATGLPVGLRSILFLWAGGPCASRAPAAGAPYVPTSNFKFIAIPADAMIMQGNVFNFKFIAIPADAMICQDMFSISNSLPFLLMQGYARKGFQFQIHCHSC